MSQPYSIEELVRRCADDDRAAWEEAWLTFEVPIRAVIKRTLRAFSPDLNWIDDVEQEFYLSLRRNSARRLRSFHGSGRPAFVHFVCVLAFRFTLDWMSAPSRAADCVGAGTLLEDAADPHRATEAQVHAVYAALVARMPAVHLETLRELLGGPDGMLNVGADAIDNERPCWSASTRRRRLDALYHWCVQQLLEPGHHECSLHQASGGADATGHPPRTAE